MKSATARSTRKPARAPGATAASASQALRLEEFYDAAPAEVPQVPAPHGVAPAFAPGRLLRAGRTGSNSAAARTAAEMALWAELADRSDPGSSLSSGSVATGAAAPHGAPHPDTSGALSDQPHDDGAAATPSGGVDRIGAASLGVRMTASNELCGLAGLPLPKDNE